MIQKQTSDPILDEIHRTRREMSDRFGGDFRAMLDDARRRQEESGRPIWQPKHDEQAEQPDPASSSTSNP
ncbi:MAG: hypothetical protein O2955_02700 [Planctomycetota bacterium]|nr:hypothetical protein [Planctomycetota bacterium]MDA1211395.1 hypothetical protein [Planctomycetota bacterium]